MQGNKRKGLLLQLIVLLGLAMLPMGCSADKDSPEACRYDAIMALDRGDYNGALNLLAKSSCQSAFAQEELELNRAAAYIGRAGYDILDLTREIVNTDTEDDETADARLIEVFANKATGAAMGDLERASVTYRKMLDVPTNFETIAKACDQPETLSALQKDACFNNGLLASAKAASTISLLFGGTEGIEELLAWLDKDGLDCSVDRNQDGTADQGEITACALKIAKDPNADCGPTTAGSPRPVTFDSNELTAVKVELNINNTCGEGVFSRYRMLSKLSDTGYYTVAITEGFCQNDMTPCEGPDYTLAIANNECWPCPVIKDDSSLLTMTNTLITTLNEEADTLISMLPEDEQEGVRDDLNEFRAEICGQACDEITEDMIINYLLQ